MRGVESKAVETDVRWRTLYRTATVAALLSVLLTPAAVIFFIVWPPPIEGTPDEWFVLFQDNRLVGLLSMDLLLLVIYVLLVPIFLALLVALWRHSESWMVIGTALGLLGIATFLASNTAIQMMGLSSQYTAAATEAERAELLAAGWSMLATYQGTAFHASYIIGSIAGIIVSAIMVKSSAFGKAPGYVGVVGNIVGFGLYLPVIGIMVSAASGIILWVWYILLMHRFFRLGWGT